MNNQTSAGPQRLVLLGTLVSALALAACGGGSGSSGSTTPPPAPPAVSVAISPAAAQAMDQGQSLNFTATVSNDSTNKGVTWSVSGGGVLSNQTSSAATYTAPASVSGPVIVTLTATSLASSSATATDKITVNPDPAVTTSTLAVATVGVAYSVTLAASGGTGALTWAVNQGTLPAGLSLSAAGVLSGTPTAAGAASFSATATDAAKVASPAAALSLVVSAAAPPALAITTATLSAATAGTAYTATLAATGGVTPYSWSLASGSSLPAGLSLSAAGVVTGTPSAAGTASFTVQVADAEATPAVKTQALTLTVNASSGSGSNNDGEFKGQYAFIAADPSTTSGALLAASVSADGSGHISGGEYDLKSNSTNTSVQQQAIAGGSYNVGSDGRGTMSFTDAQGNSYTFAIALGALSSGVATHGGLILTSGQFEMTGELYQQDPSAFSQSALAGSFAFGLRATNSSFSEAGSFTASAAGAVSNGLLDFNSSGNVVTNQAFTGAISALDTNGRGTATLSAGTNGLLTPNVVLYTVSSDFALLFDADQVPGDSGVMARQSGGPYSAASMKGNSILTDQSATGVPSAHVAVGVLTFDGVSAVSGISDTNDGGAIFSDQSISGLTYAITSAANGRLTMSGSGINTGAAYLISPNSAIAINIAGSSPQLDRLYAQSAGPFTAASLQGTFVAATLAAPAAPVAPPTSVAAYTVRSGELSFDGVGAISGTEDSVVAGATGSTSAAVSDTYAVASNGRVTTGSGSPVYYIVSPTHVLGVLVTANNPNPVVTDLWQAPQSGGSPGGIGVSISPASSQAIDQGQALNFTAAVSNDASNKGVSWSVSGGGTLSNQTSTSVTYTAPATVSTAVTATLTAASVASSTAAASVTISVSPAPAVTTTTLAAATVGTAYSAALAASGGTGALTWAVSQGALPAGLSLSTSGVLSGTPSAAGASSFSVTATDAANVTSPAVALSLTVNAGSGSSNPNDAEFKGQYAFLVHDPNGLAPATLASSVSADGNGNITGGEYDLNGSANAHQADAITGGTYTVGSDSRGSLTFHDASGVTFTFAIAIGTLNNGIATQGGLIETDGNHLMAGTLGLQDASAFNQSALSGSFAFGVREVDSQFAEAGSFTASSAGAVSNGLLDANSNGTVTAAQAFTGTMGTVDAHGRGTLTIVAGGTTSNLAFYTESANSLLLFATNASPGPAISGEADRQSGGPFSAASLSGNVILVSQSATGVPSPHITIGLLTSDGVSALSGTDDEDDGGTVSLNQSISGLTYSVTSAANGRFTISGSGIHTIAGYFISPNNAFSTDIGVGDRSELSEIYAQSAGPFTAASVKGTFVLSSLAAAAPPVAPPNGVPPYSIVSGVITLDGISALSGTLDSANATGNALGGAYQTTYAVASNGRVTTGDGTGVGYIIAPNFVVIISMGSANNPNPTVSVVRQ